jgi:hypothetical protein|tara:strand:- start:281 stop:547 length:267 start_codon:yes stop_codon:yes gene_type:complete
MVEDYSFDFGFTAVDEDELEVVQKLAEEKTSASFEALGIQERLDGLYSSVLPLLNNLAANPDKSYIYWPNRLDKIEEFRDKLTEIYRG